MDPPAYTPTPSARPTTTQRSIEDTRALILSNAQIIRPRLRIEGSVTIVLGKAKPQAPPGSATTSRSFTHSTSNTTIRIADVNGDESRRGSAVENVPDANPQRQQGKHFASLVARGNSQQIQQILRGEPQDTVEEALEWLLDRTEIVVAEMLERHAKQMTSGCCMGCDKALGGLPADKRDRTQLAGWIPPTVDRTQLAGWLPTEQQ